MQMRKLAIAIMALSIGILGGCTHKGETAEQPPVVVSPPDSDQPTDEPPTQTPETPDTPEEEPATPAVPETPDQPEQAPDDEITQQVEKMSLDEKLGAMIIAGVDGTMGSQAAKRMIASQHVGGVIFYANNIKTPTGVVAYVNQLKAWNKDNASPLIVSVDQEGGRVSRLPGLVKLPTAKAIGDTGNSAYATKIGSILGEASMKMGFNLDFAPVLDINSNPKNPVIGDRSYGSTPKLVTKMGIAAMEAIEAEGVIPVVKHFPGHGDTSVDSHLELPVVNKSEAALKAFEWVPFQEAIDKGVDAVMIAHILFPEVDANVPASLSKRVITDELRGELGFKGVVMTDDLTMGAIAKNYGMGEAAVMTVKAGSDILLVAHEYKNVDAILAALKKSVNSGEITVERIDESVKRILVLKGKYELTDDKTPPAPNLDALNAAIQKAVAVY
ncbi:beta-N-acetylhexosaminidase [Paenibacillus sp. CF384]|uniref:beta-N-acetylhexosaminidase n=1 Tax=Paenibacillus sp. CF384 TaxID=1884382 RepID=UPI000899CEF9|nr:beta-N-acetylhexosaminidase [Paenibacillus sp. CF384]SDX25489.1 beta-N-acetylhexosaminidase [Paenibacillus sp. CF384]